MKSMYGGILVSVARTFFCLLNQQKYTGVSLLMNEYKFSFQRSPKSWLENYVSGSLFVLLSIYASDCTAFGEKTVLMTRPQGLNGIMELVGLQELIHHPVDEDTTWYTAGAIAPIYRHSADANRIACFMTGGSNFVVSGSQVSDRRPTDLLADNFLLPSDFLSCIHFNPVITTFIMDLDWSVFFDAGCFGVSYVRIHIPITHAKWDVRLTEDIITTGTRAYPAGYIAATDVARNNLAPSVMRYFEGRVEAGDDYIPLQAGKIFGRQSRTFAADVRFTGGLDFLISDWYHVGVKACVTVPTGNRVTSEFLMQPVIGNGHFWEFGGGVSAHVDVWECDLLEQGISFWTELYVGHLFTRKQIRSFDLKNNGPGSRYMLVEEISTPAQNIFTGAPSGTLSTYQYSGGLQPAINATTLPVDVSITAQADLTFKCAYRICAWEFDVGYDLYIRAKESFTCGPQMQTGKFFVLKGDAQLYGFDIANNAVPLSISQSQATIHAGQGTGNSMYTNENGDNPQPGFDQTEILYQLDTTDAAQWSIAQQQVNMSTPAIIITSADLDVERTLLPRAISHTIFFHINHIWDVELCMAGLGIGASGEFAGPRENNSAFNQWSVWLRGELAF